MEIDSSWLSKEEGNAKQFNESVRRWENGKTVVSVSSKTAKERLILLEIIWNSPEGTYLEPEFSEWLKMIVEG